ncbi:hypothetical protein GCM10023213_24730 [Prosthecobacter algae]|uniref:LapA family protein n=1 Tax=Prosthecobacter algae TaxID=1144682 RepID=A0ABP9P5J8_9BACT
MTPADIIAWALALGLAWVVLALCIPIERWIELHMQRRVRNTGLEKRLEELERRFKEQSPPEA